MGHTPGPWSARQAYEHGEPVEWVVEAGREVICGLKYGDPDKEEADARLIAAAPEMLAALKRLSAKAAEFQQWAQNFDETDTTDQHLTESLALAQAAIAKAEGR